MALLSMSMLAVIALFLGVWPPEAPPPPPPLTLPLLALLTGDKF